eukprot:Skav203305  [mRNA]  locus=scaffold2587:40174:44021:- [translate_table: standard]
MALRPAAQPLPAGLPVVRAPRAVGFPRRSQAAPGHSWKLLEAKGLAPLTLIGATHRGRVARRAAKSAAVEKAKRLDPSSLCLVGIGSQSSGAKFAEMLELPPDLRIFTDDEWHSCNAGRYDAWKMGEHR